MQPDGVLVELAAGIQVHHVKHGMAAPDDVERRIEYMLRDRHAVSLLKLVLDYSVIASEAKQSIFLLVRGGLLRRKCSSQ
jgi:hypothetical protein